MSQWGRGNRVHAATAMTETPAFWIEFGTDPAMQRVTVTLFRAHESFARSGGVTKGAALRDLRSQVSRWGRGYEDKRRGALMAIDEAMRAL